MTEPTRQLPEDFEPDAQFDQYFQPYTRSDRLRSVMTNPLAVLCGYPPIPPAPPRLKPAK